MYLNHDPSSWIVSNKETVFEFLKGNVDTGRTASTGKARQRGGVRVGGRQRRLQGRQLQLRRLRVVRLHAGRRQRVATGHLPVVRREVRLHHGRHPQQRSLGPRSQSGAQDPPASHFVRTETVPNE